MEKQAVCYGEGIAPYCPRCGSGEYLHNEDGNENNFCGQCGCTVEVEEWKGVEDTKENAIKAWNRRADNETD